MPNYRHCANCYNEKAVADYGEYLCATCRNTANEATQYAIVEGLDVGAVRKAALAAAAPSSMDGKHPAKPFNRIDTSGIEERLKKDASSPVVWRSSV